MSYKKFEDIQYLYENIDGQESDIDDLSNLIVEQLISEGYSENAIHSFMETADEFALQEKIMQLDEKDLGKVQKGLELLRKFGRSAITRIRRNTPVNVRKNIKRKGTEVKDALTKGKDEVVNTVKDNPKTSSVVALSGLTASAIASREKNNKDKTDDTGTNTIRDTTSSTTSSTTKDDESAARKDRIKELETKLSNKENDRKEKLNKELEVKPKVETPKVDDPAPKPEKITARTQMRQRNIDRFGADKVNALMDKQKAFKSMQAKSMMPGAKPGAAKAEFAKNFPTSNVAKDLKKSKGVKKIDPNYESYDAFDIVLGYLQESGQVDSMDEALYIMMEMDAATIQGIVRDFEILSEEAADKEKDDRLVKYGIGHDGSDRKSGSGGSSDSKRPKGKTNPQKEAEKKHGKGKSPLDVAKANIISKYGKGAIAPSKKKKK